MSTPDTSSRKAVYRSDLTPQFAPGEAFRTVAAVYELKPGLYAAPSFAVNPKHRWVRFVVVSIPLSLEEPRTPNGTTVFTCDDRGILYPNTDSEPTWTVLVEIGAVSHREALRAIGYEPDSVVDEITSVPASSMVTADVPTDFAGSLQDIDTDRRTRTHWHAQGWVDSDEIPFTDDLFGVLDYAATELSRGADETYAQASYLGDPDQCPVPDYETACRLYRFSEALAGVAANCANIWKQYTCPAAQRAPLYRPNAAESLERLYVAAVHVAQQIGDITHSHHRDWAFGVWECAMPEETCPIVIESDDDL